MIRALFTPRWLGALILSALLAVAAYHLGFWQYHRHEAKRDNAARVATLYDAAPVPLSGVIGPQPLDRRSEWTRVTATGSYGGSTLLVRARTRDGTVGFEAVTPFTLATGATVLVDRGWIAYAADAAIVPDVAPPPAGTRTITGWARVGEQSRNRPLPRGQLATLNLTDASAALHIPLLGGYVLLDTPETPPDELTPRGLGRPNTDLGPHQAYAFQWWLAMPLGFVLVGFGLRRELRGPDDRRPSGAPPVPERQVTPVVVTAPAARGPGTGAESAEGGSTTAEPLDPVITGRSRPPRPAKPKKVRIWDEEDG